MYDEIDPPTAAARVQEGWRLLDVRTAQEFAQGHPAGAVNVPIVFMGPLGMQPNPNFVAMVREHFGSDTPLVVSCKSGGRSAHACGELAAAGYRELANLLGGFSGGRAPDGRPIPGWKASGLPTGP